ncbi:MAG: alpha-L-fucosidase [Bacteroidales bacterium]|nr:alpha-L-fucosidase [Bacteroidales bacterium]
MMKKTLILLIVTAAVAACSKTPTALGPTPTEAQLQWQQLETYAFIHFGLNTFNDMEWGYGDTPASTFNPTDLDCEQWVLTLKACGMQGVILTAKHHDGFCLWPTETTDYCIKNSPYKNGQGDVVGELCEACRKHGLRFGLYLSPWDRHQASYGTEEYVKLYHQQIQELTYNYGPFFEFWFDGANGGDGWYGGANETRSIDANTYYDFEKARAIVCSGSPETMVFGGTVPTIRWIGNERGYAAPTLWCTVGDAWLPAEVDVSIRPGWFYHESEQPKALEELLDIYFNSVGHNANLLLNFPVNKEGRIPSIDSLRAVEWHQTLQNLFSEDLMKACKTSSSDPYANLQEQVFSFDNPTTLSCLVLQEDITKGQHVERFSISRYRNGKWLPLDTDEVMTTIGYKRIIRFKPAEMEKLRIRFIKTKGPVMMKKVSGYQ